MWPFKREPFLPDDSMRWHVEIACWYLRHYGRQLIVTQSRLILPGPYCYKLGDALRDAAAFADELKTAAW